jgi:hypothetical protein
MEININCNASRSSAAFRTAHVINHYFVISGGAHDMRETIRLEQDSHHYPPGANLDLHAQHQRPLPRLSLAVALAPA